MTTRRSTVALLLVVFVYLHNTLPGLTMMPRVNVDEPWLMERAYQIMRTGIPSQPMLGLHHAYLLQVGYGYLLAGWMALTGVGLFQARLLGVVLGLGIILMVASIGRRTIDPVTGIGAALFLAADSNFLGGVRNARTDIPSVFFVAGALAAYLAGRTSTRKMWFLCAGACLGCAVLCHGNAFWVGFVLLGWFLLDYGVRVPVLPEAYAFLGGLLLTFGPYLAIVLTRWSEMQLQIGNFAADRVPGWRPSFILHQITLEIGRYRGWYFGLVTNTVPNPFLRAFQIATIAGVIALVIRASRLGSSRGPDPHGPARLLILVGGSVLIFAGFINNKVPVYMPHLLVGFSLAAGFAVSEAVALTAAIVNTRNPAILQFCNPAISIFVVVLAYGGTAVAYYEKWYSSIRKGELVPFEATAATLRALVPAGPKYLFASPQFWPPFHDEPDTTFYSYAAAWPIERESTTTLVGIGRDHPIFLVVDELQWLPELTGPTSSTSEWQQGWINFIEHRCALDGVALGTAHGNIALYRCGLDAAPAAGTAIAMGSTASSRSMPRIIGGATEYTVAEPVLTQTAAELARWPRYEDPRRTGPARQDVGPTDGGLRIAGTGWPGIVKMFEAPPGGCYLVRTRTTHTRDGDLLYLGTWQQPQVRSLAGASSSGIAAPLLREPWFPRDRAFVATASSIRVLVYSEAPETDFVISSLDIYRLRPTSEAAARR